AASMTCPKVPRGDGQRLVRHLAECRDTFAEAFTHSLRKNMCHNGLHRASAFWGRRKAATCQGASPECRDICRDIYRDTLCHKVLSQRKLWQTWIVATSALSHPGLFEHAQRLTIGIARRTAFGVKWGT